MKALSLLDFVTDIFDAKCTSEDIVLRENLARFTSSISTDTLVESERTGRFLKDELTRFASAGLMAELSPHVSGGALNWQRAMRLASATAAWDLDFALTLGGAVLAGTAVLVAGNSDQQKSYFSALMRGEVGGLALSEWEHGSDLLANECVAVAQGSDFVLNGTKGPINNGSMGAHVVVLARTGERNDSAGASLFMIERGTSGLSAERVYPTIGFRNMDLARVVLNDARVPSSAVLGQVGEGFVHLRRTLEISRSGVAAMACGALAQTVFFAASHAQSRKLYGASIGELPAIRTLVAKCAARLILGVAVTRTAARAVSNWAVSARAWSSAAKWLLPTLLERNIHDAGTVLGARSLMEDLPFAQLRRSAPVLAIFDGSSLLQLDELFRYATFWQKSDASREAAQRALFASDDVPFDPHRTDEHGVLDALSPFNGPLAKTAEALQHAARDARKTVSLRGPVSEVAAWLYAVNALDYSQTPLPEAVKNLALHEVASSLLEPCARLGIAHGLRILSTAEFDSAANATFGWLSAHL